MWRWLGLFLLTACWVVGIAATARTNIRRIPATYDEPLHLAAGRLYHTSGDYRMNPEHPPLFKWMATAGLDPLQPAPADRLLEKLSMDPRVQWQWAATRFLGAANRTEFEATLRHARNVQLVWLGLLIGLAMTWAWMNKGLAAAFMAAVLVGLDPTVQAHGALVTNDVAAATAALASFMCLDMASRAASNNKRKLWLCGLVTAIALGVCLKATGILVALSVGLILMVLCLRGRQHRVVWGVTLLMMPVVSVAALWASYGLRYSAGPKGESLDFPALVQDIRQRKGLSADAPTPLALQAAAWTTEHHLLPEAYVYGLGVQYRISLRSRTFAFGQNYDPAPIWYLPAVLLLKEPLTWLLVVGSAGVIGGVLALRRQGWSGPSVPWLSACTLLFAIFLISGKGRGVRYLLPVTTPLAVAAAVTWAGVAARGPNRARGLGFAAAMIAASVMMFGEHVQSNNALSYFNGLAQRLGPKHTLLGDSNLDWGQTYRAIAELSAHDGPVYFAAFGTVDPTASATPIAPGYFLSPPSTTHVRDLAQSDRKGILLVSATMWHATYLNDDIKAEYLQLQQTPPDEVLEDGALLLYRLPLKLAERR